MNEPRRQTARGTLFVLAVFSAALIGWMTPTNWVFCVMFVLFAVVAVGGLS